MRKNAKRLILLTALLLIVLIAGCSTLRTAAYQGDTAKVKELLDQGADVNDNINGETVLAVASIQGHVDTARLLLDRGASVNKSIGYGLTPLFYAVQRGHAEVARVLIERGGDVDGAMAKFRSLGPQGAQGLVLLERLTSKQQAAAGTSTPPQRGARDSAPAIESDIDAPPAVKAKPNRNAYAIVIGIEQYRQKLPKADFAVSDAKLVSEYLIRVLGYPEENVVLLTNDKALQSDMAKYFEKWLHNNVEKDGTVFVYYSGHGAPNPQTGDAYLVPYDGDPSFITETGYSLKRMYGALGKLPAREITVVLDSCFSGAGGRSVLAKGARPLVMNLHTDTVLPKKLTILAASSGEQISSTYDEKGHGLFTYFMLKGIKNENVVRSDGSLAIEDLFSYLKPQVERISRKQYNNEQTPQLMSGKKN